MTDASTTSAPVAAPAYPTVDITVTLPKAEYDLVQALVGLTKSVQAAESGGFSLGKVPAIILDNLTALQLAAGEASQLPAEVKSAPAKIGVALAVGLDEILS